MPHNGEQHAENYDDAAISLTTASKLNTINLRQHSNYSTALVGRPTSNDQQKFAVEGEDPMSFAVGTGVDKSIGSFKPFSFGEQQQLYRNSNQLDRPETRRLEIKESILEAPEGEEAESQGLLGKKPLQENSENMKAHQEKFDSLFPEP